MPLCRRDIAPSPLELAQCGGIKGITAQAVDIRDLVKGLQSTFGAVTLADRNGTIERHHRCD